MIQASEFTAAPWPADRLREARAVLADIAHHPDTRVELAARVIAAHSPDETERADARALNRSLKPGISAAAVRRVGAT